MALAFSLRFAFVMGVVASLRLERYVEGGTIIYSRRRWKTELKHVGKIQPSDFSDRAITAILQEFRYLTAEHPIIE